MATVDTIATKRDRQEIPDHELHELARLCVKLGEHASRSTGALISDMSQPLGDMIGNAIEVREAIEVLRGDAEAIGIADIIAPTVTVESQ